MLDLNNAVILNDEVLINDLSYDKSGKLLVLRFYKGNCLVDTIPNIKSKEQAKLIIADYKEFDYIFIPISETLANTINDDWEYTRKNKQDVLNFVEEYGIHPRDILACGDTNAKNEFVKHYIPYINITDTTNVLTLADKEKAIRFGKFITAYKCFACKDTLASFNNPSNGGVIKHEDALSSWNCLMNKLHNPTHGIIIKKYK